MGWREIIHSVGNYFSLVSESSVLPGLLPLHNHAWPGLNLIFECAFNQVLFNV